MAIQMKLFQLNFQWLMSLHLNVKYDLYSTVDLA